MTTAEPLLRITTECGCAAHTALIRRDLLFGQVQVVAIVAPDSMEPGKAM